MIAFFFFFFFFDDKEFDDVIESFDSITEKLMSSLHSFSKEQHAVIETKLKLTNQLYKLYK